MGYNPVRPTEANAERTRFGKQRANISPFCWSFSGILHELGLLVGLHHAHQHPDRTVIVKRADADETNYGKLRLREITGEYDKNSVMHYGYTEGVCTPKTGVTADNTCHYANHPTGCRQATAEDCQDGESATDQDVGTRGRFTPDVRAVKALYAEELAKRASA